MAIIIIFKLFRCHLIQSTWHWISSDQLIFMALASYHAWDWITISWHPSLFRIRRNMELSLMGWWWKSDLFCIHFYSEPLLLHYYDNYLLSLHVIKKSAETHVTLLHHARRMKVGTCCHDKMQSELIRTVYNYFK
jgi:hypothetical protein